MIKNISIDLLVPFENHPFKKRSGIEQQELTESIKENGLLEPIIVRSFPAGKYEIISGHRRVEACKELGITSIPVTIKELTKDEAIVQMVDSNIHREHILPSEKAFAFKDVNEPIIDRETFETVQKFISKTKRRAPKKENGERSIFNGLIYCGDCHSKMRYHTSTSNKEIHYFTCSDNKVDYRGKCPGRHYVRADALEKVVKLELRRLVEMLEIDESYFAQLLLRKNDEEREKDKKFLETELQKAIARSGTVSQLYEKLYEDNVIGKVNDEWFVELSHKYEKERMDLKAKIADTRHQIEELKNTNSEYGKFISAIRRFMQMDNLTSPLLRELIDHIDIFETEGTGKSRTQRIVIYYRFIGYIELPNTAKQTHIADTRKGVAVEYITEQFTA